MPDTRENENTAIPPGRSLRRRHCRWRCWGVRALGLLVLVGVLDAGRFFLWPDVSALARTAPEKTAFMTYREAQWKDEGQKRTLTHRWVPLGRISSHLVLAVTIAEDDRFWAHDGFDLEGIEDAVRRNWEVGRLAAGGSTISQQLAKNIYFSPEKSLLRKVREAIVTWRLERELDKRRILELYLNSVEWGEGIFGAEAASRHYFGKSAAALSVYEAAGLAAILPSPLTWRLSPPSRGVAKRIRIIERRMERRLGSGRS